MNQLFTKNKIFSFSFVINGLETDPDFFDTVLGTTATRSFRYGEAFESRLSSVKPIRRNGLWNLSSCRKIKEYDDESHVQYVLNQLKKPGPNYFYEIKEKKLNVYFSFGVECLYPKEDKASLQELLDYINQKYESAANEYHAGIVVDPYFDDSDDDDDATGVLEGEALRRFLGLEEEDKSQ